MTDREPLSNPETDRTKEAYPTGAPPDGAKPDVPAAPAVPPVEDESTVGTGTSIALGCVAGTILLIIIGLVVLGIVALVN
jgi:hypothetical protein